MKKTAKIIMAVISVLAFTAFSVHMAKPAMAYEHGTTDKTITQDMLKDTPPADYKINQDMQGSAKDGTYNEYFLKDRLQTVSINIDEDNLNYLLQNAEQKPSVMTNSVTIGGKTIGYTGLKTKGNYTLQHTFTEEGNNIKSAYFITDKNVPEKVETEKEDDTYIIKAGNTSPICLAIIYDKTKDNTGSTTKVPQGRQTGQVFAVAAIAVIIVVIIFIIVKIQRKRNVK